MVTKILTSPSYSFENDCREIHDSSTGHPNHVVTALAVRGRVELEKIKQTYKEMYGEELMSLVHEHEQELSQEATKALSMLLVDPHERDAVVARQALLQEEPNYKALLEIFVGRKSSHMVMIRRAYHTKYKSHLDQDIINIDPPHAFQRILVALATSHKAHQADVSQHIAKCDARRLYETGEGSPQGAIDDAVVLEIMSKRSISQLQLTFSSYKHIYGHNYSKSLKNIGREFEDALQTVVECILDPHKYYAKILYATTKGTVNDSSGLTRIMVSRADTDLNEIQMVFKKKYNMELTDAISNNIVATDYRDFLVALATKASLA